jgi:NADH:ubiquinone oxidoreductase subunit H
MKQFLICTLLTILLYLGGSAIICTFDMRMWLPEGRFWFVMFTFFIWIFPILLNYINGEPNFED